MKKLLSILFFIFFLGSQNVLALSPTYSNPTASTMDFYPLMQYQMEKQETLDFVNDSENYKQKRAKKDAENEYRAGNKNFNPNYGSNSSLTRFLNNSENMQFTTDSNGNIIIKDSAK